MRATERIALIDRIGRILQSRYTFTEIDEFLAAYFIPPPKDVTANSKWVYSKAALKSVDTSLLVKIADDLDIDTLVKNQNDFPANWKDSKGLRLFISHISTEKIKATRLKGVLVPFGISAFVAHEDIHPTLEWQREIERALHTMEAFVSIHTIGFSKSIWTQQEIGFAVARGVKVIALKMGEDPTGFISRHQALARGNRTAEEIAIEINKLLEGDPKTSARLKEAQLALAADDIPF